MASNALRRRGFTLVEVLAAVGLLSIGLLAVLSASRVARDTQWRAVHLATARNIAQSKIDELRATLFDSIVIGTVQTTDSSLPRGNQITVVTAKYPDTSESNLIKVTVTVTWPEGKATGSVQYESLIVRR
jgi:prepilin-type N-terminal cleavage/methylation domain-containing protein